MVLDSKIQLVKLAFGIQSLDDWTSVDPRDILALDGVGPATLDHIRLYLAGQGRALHNDRTPEYWQEELDRVKVVHQMADEDSAVICPFTILIDSAEQQPFGFQNIRADADQQHRQMIVKTEWRSLGRHPNGLGDYSIDGYVGRAHVERKSVQDLHGTLLGFNSGARERFECELENLSQVDAAMVVVEGSYGHAIKTAGEYGTKPSKTQRKILSRSVLALMQDYSVRWLFCDSRGLAEISTFRFLERYWRKQLESKKEPERLLADI